MNANELAKLLEVDSWHKLVTREEIATTLRQQQEQIENLKQWEKRQLNVIEAQQAEIEALKKTCLDEITKRVYADQTTKVIEGYWEEAQAEIEMLRQQVKHLESQVYGGTTK